MDNSIVKLKWSGKEATLVRLEEGGSKVEVEPGDVVEMASNRAENIANAYREWNVVSGSKVEKNDGLPKMVRGKKENCKECKDLEEGLVTEGHDHRVVEPKATKKKTTKKGSKKKGKGKKGKKGKKSESKPKGEETKPKSDGETKEPKKDEGAKDEGNEDTKAEDAK